MKKTFTIIIGIILGIVVVGFAVFIIFIYPHFKEQAEVRNMSINEVNLLKVLDGTYKGDFSYGNFTYEVEVIVANHKIENIDILKNRSDSEHAKKAEGVVEKVINAQSPNVEVVTGATTTSKALLKAIENALNKGFSQ